MRQDGDEIHMEVDEARGASTPNVVRWVLTFGLLGAIILLTAIWVIGAWSSDQNTQSVDAQIRAEQKAGGGNANDSIVSDKADQMKAAKPGESKEPLNMPNKNANGGQ
jgi:hypothetical protein